MRLCREQVLKKAFQALLCYHKNYKYSYGQWKRTLKNQIWKSGKGFLSVSDYALFLHEHYSLQEGLVQWKKKILKCREPSNINTKSVPASLLATNVRFTNHEWELKTWWSLLIIKKMINYDVLWILIRLGYYSEVVFSASFQMWSQATFPSVTG